MKTGKKPSKSSTSLCQLIGTLSILMLGVEYFAYSSLNLSIDYNNLEEEAPKSKIQTGINKRTPKKVFRQNQDMISLHSYDVSDTTAKLSPEKIKDERAKTAKRLTHMDVSEDFSLEELPPWSQILDNFHPETRDDEPIILGLEHCEAFRKEHDVNVIGFAAAGMFSTGTNLLGQLGRTNCRPPKGRKRNRRSFIPVQVPWGKHNPAHARFHFNTAKTIVEDRSAILPVVSIRHPYTWMSTMCKHSYGTVWKHVKPRCHEFLNLTSAIRKVPYGFKNYTDPDTQKVVHVDNTYKNLAQMWLDWYKPYFLADQHGHSPRLMIRHEDMVYRPEKVISKICECVGGTNQNPKPWDQHGGFQYQEEGANKGKGHGKHRSGLLTAVIKYGQPLRNWYDQYPASDRTIMKETFQGESDPALKAIFDAFQYKLFDDVGPPTRKDKMKVGKRMYLEAQQKEKREAKD